MKDAFVLVVTAVLFFACTGPTVAQEIELIPELKPYEPILGEWTGELEVRESPTSDWTKGPWTWKIRSGGYFVEFAMTVGVGKQQNSGIEILGYDPIQQTFVSSGFGSDGGHLVVTSEGWSGTTLSVNFTHSTADREVKIRRATWEYSSDFKSVAFTGEMFTDGQWWITGKAKNTKVE